MSRFILPIILVAITLSVFFLFTQPIYNQINLLRASVQSYDDALSNSKALENERDKLTAKYNTEDPANLTKIEKLLPDNVDNIRLILEIEQLAAPFNMVLTDVKYSVNDEKPQGQAGGTGTGTGTIQTAVARGGAPASPKDYGIFELDFSTSGSYDNFINFTKQLEQNLRIVDISSVSFSSTGSVSSGLGNAKQGSDSYDYNFKIKTYWLKN